MTKIFLVLSFIFNLSASEVIDADDRENYISSEVGDWMNIIGESPPFYLIFDDLKSKGYTDNEICSKLLDRIEQPEKPPGQKKGLITAKAAGLALYYYRGNAAVEKAVLAACDTDLYDSLLQPVGYLSSTIAYYGSDELIDEYCNFYEKKWGHSGADKKKYMLEEVDRPRHKRDLVKTNSNQQDLISANGINDAAIKPDAWQPPESNINTNPLRVSNDPHQSNETISNKSKSALRQTACAVFLVAGILLMLLGVWRKKKYFLAAGVGLIAASSVGYVYFKRIGSTSSLDSESSARTGANLQQRDSYEIDVKLKPDAWKPEPYRPPPPPKKKETEYRKLCEVIRALSAPFSHVDPVDRITNQKERESAALKLLALLDAGKPEGISEEQWLSIFPQVVQCMSCSTHCMDQAMKTINLWIGNEKHSDYETAQALRYMMAWEGTEYFLPDSEQVKRYHDIVAMQTKLYPNASMRTKGDIINSLSNAAKHIKRPKSVEPEFIVDDQKLLGVMKDFYDEYRGDVQALNSLHIALHHRLISSREPFDVFEDLIKNIALEKNQDKNVKLHMMSLVAISSESSKRMPEWMSDADIVAHLKTCYQNSFSAKEHDRGIDKPDYFATQTWDIAYKRSFTDPEATALHYGKLMLTMVDNAALDPSRRVELLKLATKINLMTPSDVIEKYSNDPRIGNDVKNQIK